MLHLNRRFALAALFILIFVLLACKSSEGPVLTPESTSSPLISPSPEISASPTEEPISFHSGTYFTGEETELAVVLNADEFFLLDFFPHLKSLDLSGSVCYEEILAYVSLHPDVSVHYTVLLGDCSVSSEALEAVVSSLPDPEQLLYLPGLRTLTISEPLLPNDVIALKAVRNDLELYYSIEVAGLLLNKDIETLDLSSVSPEYADDLLHAVSVLPHLSKIILSPAEGSPLWSIEQADAFQNVRDGLLVDYRISAFGVTFSLCDEVVSFNDINLKNRQDELKALLPYLRNVKRLDMESCGISNADMAALREEFPSPKIVWRVNVGRYSCRTDAVMIRFSSKLEANCLYDKDVEVLRYCNEIRYLDLGHNHIKKMDFLSCMPDLEVVIIAVGYMEDITGIANHDKLEYCEFLSGRIRDLSPLASCPNLEHLNVSYNLITDITPLYGLTKLKRLWISRNAIPKEQITEIKQLLPETEINTTSHNPTGEGWRYISERDLLLADRYALLCRQFCYGTKTITYTEDTRPVYESE